MSNLRSPEVPAALIANFAEYRLIKTRGVLALIVEVPVERQAEAFAALGFPQPGQEIPVAVARLNNPGARAEPTIRASAGQADPVGRTAGAIPATGADRSAQAKAHYASLPEMEKAVVRAAQLPKDLRFRQWVCLKKIGRHEDYGIEASIRFIRDLCCAGRSRGFIADDPECYERFLAMETQYKMDTGQMAEVR